MKMETPINLRQILEYKFVLKFLYQIDIQRIFPKPSKMANKTRHIHAINELSIKIQFIQ